jgi:threonine dehydratase
LITIPELTATAIRAAHGRIDPAFTHSPQFVHDGLSRRLGVPVIVKVETVNPIRSFKGRGTWIASRVAIPRAVELMAGRVDEMRLVSEAALHDAQAVLTDELGVTVEGAAAASWAGLLTGPAPDGPALVIVTGSNV